MLEERSYGPSAEGIAKVRNFMKAEKEREIFFGKTRPIIHTDFQGHKVVAVGSQIHWGKSWKTFIDFLVHYITTVFGKNWGNQELKKPFNEMHQILKWYVKSCEYQKKQTRSKDGLYDAVPNGPFAAYLLLAYDLYILRHHARIHDELVRRLKHPFQFQGTRYELFAAATCIRAGYDLEFENEADRRRTHVEFIANHKPSGQKVCVEAKSKHRAGVLGFSSRKPRHKNKVMRGIMRLLNDAFAKDHEHPLVVFVDMNISPDMAKEVFAAKPSDELKGILSRTGRTDKGRDKFNFLVFTNHPHHYGREDEPDPRKDVRGILPLKPEIIPKSAQAILDICDAATLYGNVPVDFPEEL